MPRRSVARYFRRMSPFPASPATFTSHGPRIERSPPVWLPWVLAPVFLLLPLGGCGLSVALRRPQAAAQAAGQPEDLPVGTVATVATVMPAGRTVAWRPKAN